MLEQCFSTFLTSRPNFTEFFLCDSQNVLQKENTKTHKICFLTQNLTFCGGIRYSVKVHRVDRLVGVLDLRAAGLMLG